MANLRNWTINAYTKDEWTTLAKAPVIIRSLIIANSGSSTAKATVRISNGPDDERAVILPETEIFAGESQVFDLCQLNLGQNDVLQVKIDEDDVSVAASGEEV